MFLRFKPVHENYATYPRGQRYIHSCSAWEVYLVESVRTPAGPRQRHVAYLGRLPHWTEKALRGEHDAGDSDLDGVFARMAERERVTYLERWWAKIESRLDRLGNRVPAADRAAILTRLEEHAPRPGRPISPTFRAAPTDWPPVPLAAAGS